MLYLYIYTATQVDVEADLSIRTHFLRMAGRCFAALRQIWSIRRWVTHPVLESSVVSLVLSRLDYGSATLAGLLSHLLDRLQSVQNAAARLIFSVSCYVRITPATGAWADRVEVSGARVPLPSWLGTRLPVSWSGACRRRLLTAATSLCIAMTSALVDRRTQRATVCDHTLLLLLCLHQPSGTAYRRKCCWPHHCQCSTKCLKFELFKCFFGPRHSTSLTSFFCNVIL